MRLQFADAPVNLGLRQVGVVDLNRNLWLLIEQSPVTSERFVRLEAIRQLHLDDGRRMFVVTFSNEVCFGGEFLDAVKLILRLAAQIDCGGAVIAGADVVRHVGLSDVVEALQDALGFDLQLGGTLGEKRIYTREDARFF